MIQPNRRKMGTVLKKIFALAVISIGLLSTSPTMAEQTNIHFDVLYDPENELYASALKIMQDDIFLKKVPEYWDYKENKWRSYPLIAIGEFDLNGDGKKEAIVNPVEKVPAEEGVICDPKQGCPIFILDKNWRGKTRIIGVFNAHGVAVDNSVHNNYRRLRAYTKNPEINPEYYELYQLEKSSYKKLELR